MFKAQVSKLLYKELDSEYFQLNEPYSFFSATTQFYPCNVNTAIDNMRANEHGYVLKTLFIKTGSVIDMASWLLFAKHWSRGRA